MSNTMYVGQSSVLFKARRVKHLAGNTHPHVVSVEMEHVVYDFLSHDAGAISVDGGDLIIDGNTTFVNNSGDVIGGENVREL